MDDQMTRSANRATDTARSALDDASGKIGESTEQMRDQAQRTAGDTMEQARTMARDFGGQARTMARDFGEQARTMANSAAQALPPRAREQAMAAGDMIYRQTAWTGDYLVRQVNENPMTAVLVAAGVGYMLAYMIHSRSA